MNSDWNLKSKKTVVWLLILNALVIGVCLVFSHDNLSNKRIYQTQSQKLEKLKKQLSTKKTESLNTVYKEAVLSGNNKVSQSAKQQLASKNMSVAATGLFSAIYSYKDSQEYKNRVKVAAPYATKDVTGDTSIFTDGKGSTGDNYITGSQKHVSFVSADVRSGLLQSDNTLTGIVVVSAKSGIGDYTEEPAEDVYKVNYSETQGKVTHIERLSTLDISSNDVNQ